METTTEAGGPGAPAAGAPSRLGRGALIPLLLTAAFTAIVGLDLGGKSFALTVDDLVPVAGAGWAGWLCWRASRRASRGRRSWLLLGIGSMCWAGGQAVWSWIELVEHHEVPFPSVADVGFLLFVPFAIVGIAGLVDSPAGRLSTMRALLEAFLVGSALLYISWVLELNAILHDTTQTLGVRALLLSYPMADVVIVAVALFALVRSPRAGVNALKWVAAGAAALALSDSGYAYLTTAGSYGATQLVDAGWLLGFVIIGLGARDPRLAAPPFDGDCPPATRASVLAPFAVAVPAVFLHFFLSGRQSYEGELIFVMMVLALLANVVAVVTENHALLTSLEARVEVRTNEVLSAEQRLFALVQDLAEVVLVCDGGLAIRYASDSAGRVLGRSSADLAGEAITALAAPSDRERLWHAVRHVVEHGAASSVGFALADSTAGAERYAHAQIRNLLHEPAVAGLVINLRDVTERRRMEEELRALALRDSLTGLPNRALFLERLDHALARCRRDGSEVTVGIVDLDGFKTVNDSLGHQAGDALLQQVAARFDPCVRANDTVARLGGDEFAFLIESEMGGTDVAARLLEALSLPFEVAGREVCTSASVGISSGSGASDRDELLRQADTAMYAAKRTGRGRFAEYDPEMHRLVATRLELEADLGRALKRGQLRLAYQPTVEVSTGVVLGFEALLRWQHHERGLVSPADFIPVAEDCGAIVPIGRWVLHEACRQAAAWQTPERPISISVNVSTVQLRAGTVVADVDAALAASGLDPHCLVVELTESVVLDDGPTLVDVLHRLRSIGVRVAIDDFGTGYSSLSYLQRLPVDILKVDKTFVDHLDEAGESNTALVRAIMELASMLSADTVAEGVERAGQAAVLESLGCHVAQGYYFAKPLGSLAATALIKHGATLAPVTA
jgi:diguanylate cyclase (GGDEF)-like protein/PAS domain S-box-containing protein